jgi:hypothetical protein
VAPTWARARAHVLNKIATFLGVNLLSRTRVQGDKLFYAFMVIAHNAASHEKVISYFDRFPLYSSKYLVGVPHPPTPIGVGRGGPDMGARPRL